MGVSQIARAVKESPSQIADDLQHLLRSLKHSDLAHFFELYHRHPHHALRLILKASPVL